MAGNFSRGKALDKAARSQHIQPGEIIFFVDVDMTFRTETLDRIRANTIEHRQVYLPIVFSQYDPGLVPHRRRHDEPHDSIAYDVGYFRQFGYGICAIFKSDIMHPGIDGFNTDITGWGLEDVKFLETIIRLNQKPKITLLNTAENVEAAAATGDSAADPSIRLAVFRAPDPSLVHVFHAIECDRQLEDAQYAMCVGTKANTLGSYKQIESVLLSNKSIVEYISSQQQNNIV